VRKLRVGEVLFPISDPQGTSVSCCNTADSDASIANENCTCQQSALWQSSVKENLPSSPYHIKSRRSQHRLQMLAKRWWQQLWHFHCESVASHHKMFCRYDSDQHSQLQHRRLWHDSQMLNRCHRATTDNLLMMTTAMVSWTKCRHNCQLLCCQCHPLCLRHPPCDASPVQVWQQERRVGHQTATTRWSQWRRSSRTMDSQEVPHSAPRESVALHRQATDSPEWKHGTSLHAVTQCTEWPNIKTNQSQIINKLYWSQLMRLDFFVKLKLQTSTVISLGIKYSMHDLICDVNYLWTRRKTVICVTWRKWCPRNCHHLAFVSVRNSTSKQFFRFVQI